MRAARWLVLSCVFWLTGACLPGEEEKLPDGSRCADGKACKSGVCTTQELCAPSACDCNGNTCPADGGASKDCSDGRVCVASTNIVEDVGMFFSGDRDNDGYCMLPCSAGCPEHHTCGGRFCQPDIGWADPVPNVAWSGALEGTLSGKNATMTYDLEPGKTVKLVASGSSPAGTEISVFNWSVVGDDGIGKMSSGSTVELAIEPGQSFRRADLTIQDAKMRSGLLSVVFQSCIGAGNTCGYQGSGCCNDCDSVTNTCK